MGDYGAALEGFTFDRARKGAIALGGVSFGAYIALALARRHPRRVDGLLLTVPEIYPPPREDRLDEAWEPRRTSTTTAQLPRGRYVEDTEWLTGLPWKDVRTSLDAPSPRILAPTLFLFGEQEPAFRAVTYWAALAGLPRATFAVLDGAGLAVWGEKRKLALPLARDGVDRVDAYRRRRAWKARGSTES